MFILEDCWGVFYYSISLRRPGQQVYQIRRVNFIILKKKVIMSNSIFYEPYLEGAFFSTSHTPQELGPQCLVTMKFLIYALVFWKIFQLTFLKYRKRLALQDRIQKKYRYCHGQFIEHYSQDENLLMYVTINNTIKNTQIQQKESLGKIKKVVKKVSFNIQMNSYYRHQNKKIEEDDEIDEFEEIDSSGKKIKNAADEGIIKEQPKEVKTVEFEVEGKDKTLGEMELEGDQSKITEETQASSLLENSNLKESLKNDPDPPVQNRIRK